MTRPLEDPDPTIIGDLRLSGSVPAEALLGSRTLHNARFLLQAAMDEPIPATKTRRALNRKFVAQAADGMQWPPGYIERIREMCKVLNEHDVYRLSLLCGALENGGMLRLYRGAFSATKRGKHLLAPGMEGALFLSVWLAYFMETNLSFMDGYAEDMMLQYSAGPIFIALLDAGERWVTLDELRGHVAVSGEVWERETRYGDIRDSIDAALHRRVLEPLEDFGLIEIETVVERRVFERVKAIRATPLLGEFVSVAPERALAPERPAADEIVTLTVALEDTDPSIWRRLEVPADYHLGELHVVLNGAMGWLDYHLHEFEIEGDRFGVPDTDWSVEGESTLPEESLLIGDVARLGIQEFFYIYDFGDDWRHLVTVEGIASAQDGMAYPRCTDGERAPVPEDCGGIPGFHDLLEVMADRKHPEHAATKAWYGGGYDPAALDLDLVNQLLRFQATGELPEGWG